MTTAQFLLALLKAILSKWLFQDSPALDQPSMKNTFDDWKINRLPGNLLKNVSQFLLLSAPDQIQSKWILSKPHWLISNSSQGNYLIKHQLFSFTWAHISAYISVSKSLDKMISQNCWSALMYAQHFDAWPCSCSNCTHKTATLFLHNTIKIAKHS